MTKLITIISILFSITCYSQDSITLRITKVRQSEDRTVYFMKDEKGNKFIAQCRCRSERKKGDEVKIAKKDLIIEREIFRKRDIEN